MYDLRFRRDVDEAQHRPSRTWRNPQNRQDRRAEVEHLLGAQRVKCGLPPAQPQQRAIVVEYAAGMPVRVSECCLERAAVELLAVQGARAPGLCETRLAVAGAEQTVHVDARHASQGEQDRLRSQETAHVDLDVRIGRIIEEIVKGDVQLVDAGRAVGIGLVRDLSAVSEGAVHQPLHRGLRKDAARRHHADAIVRRNEVEEGGPS